MHGRVLGRTSVATRTPPDTRYAALTLTARIPVTPHSAVADSGRSLVIPMHKATHKKKRIDNVNWYN